jgi:hypothetical protein
MSKTSCGDGCGCGCLQANRNRESGMKSGEPGFGNTPYIGFSFAQSMSKVPTA